MNYHSTKRDSLPEENFSHLMSNFSQNTKDKFLRKIQSLFQAQNTTEFILFCPQHSSFQVLQICTKFDCQEKCHFFCQKCLIEQQKHVTICSEFIKPLDLGLSEISSKFYNLDHLLFGGIGDFSNRSNKTQSQGLNVDRLENEKFNALAQEKEQNIEDFQNFINLQKNKILSNINIIQQEFLQNIKQIVQDLEKKFDQDILNYRKNYQQTINNSELSQNLSKIKKYSNPESLIAKIQENQQNKLGNQFLKNLKNQYNNILKNEDQFYFQSNISEIYDLINFNSVNPPTYKADQFQDFALNSIKMQIEALTNKIKQTLDFHIVNSPINSLEQFSKHQQAPKEEQIVQKIPTELISSQGQKLKLLSSLLDYKSKYMNLNLKNYHKIPANQMLLQNPRKHCILLNYHKNVYLGQGKQKKICQQPPGTCITAFCQISSDLLAYSTTANSIFLLQLSTQKIIKKIETKNWVFSIQKVKNSFYPDFISQYSLNKFIIQNPDSTMEQCGFYLVVCNEDSVTLYNTNFQPEDKKRVEPFAELINNSYFRGLSILDLNDFTNIVIGDHKGQIYVWNYLKKNLLFQKDTEGSQVHRLSLIKDKQSFVSAHKLDFELGGILIWSLKYQQDQIVECHQIRRLDQAHNVESILPLNQNQNFLISCELNQVKLYDIKEGKLIKILAQGESQIQDLLVIENKGGDNHYFIVLTLNQSVLKLVDSNEFPIGQYNIDNYNCNQCTKYFNSNKLCFIQKDEGLIRIMFINHVHSCQHSNSQSIPNNIQNLDSFQNQSICELKSNLTFQDITLRQAEQ
ncbi:WD40-repeat-containing domain [Pseudocohnilembus persalinus]|uniref:WD40-repeat-containing domain n=1 Tax=Pseudocohnilembus persalinus TaxID=266149 RepID=A0A0V0R0Z6_PSEPJ|nr:WD40-repeat-containing domain [Pseudocohnilembus persalinus]|eukprot:KRX08179.1 WD40-repeat-containing domain [Pseudocohnilembus persalinus]